MVRDRVVQEFCRLVAMAKGPQEVRELFAALLTPAELQTVAERWQIVQQLMIGATQRKVRDSLGVGIATVERGARELRYGKGTLQKFYERVKGL